MRHTKHSTTLALWWRLLPLLALVTSGCSSPGLSNSFSSPEQLGQAVLDGLAAKDAEALWDLVVTPAEHRELLWEFLPESNTYSFEYVREWSERNSRDGLATALRRLGGTEFELIRVEFTEGSEEYPDFTVFFGTKLHVRRVSDGETGTLSILDVMVVYDGRWKLMNFEE
jgi:hypothetical protein